MTDEMDIALPHAGLDLFRIEFADNSDFTLVKQLSIP